MLIFGVKMYRKRTNKPYDPNALLYIYGHFMQQFTRKDYLA